MDSSVLVVSVWFWRLLTIESTVLLLGNYLYSEVVLNSHVVVACDDTLDYPNTHVITQQTIAFVNWIDGMEIQL